MLLLSLCFPARGCCLLQDRYAIVEVGSTTPPSAVIKATRSSRSGKPSSLPRVSRSIYNKLKMNEVSLLAFGACLECPGADARNKDFDELASVVGG